MASPRPLTERQEKVLLMLLDSSERTSHFTYPPTPNEIAIAIGLDRDRARRQRGPWAGPMGPAQRVIGTLNGLCLTRKLIGHARRRDGMSGAAYMLTDEGLKVARELRTAADRVVLPRDLTHIITTNKVR